MLSHVRICFLFKAEYAIVCVDHICLFIHPPMDIWIVSTFLTIVNNAAINMAVQIFF